MDSELTIFWEENNVGGSKTGKKRNDQAGKEGRNGSAFPFNRQLSSQHTCNSLRRNPVVKTLSIPSKYSKTQ